MSAVTKKTSAAKKAPAPSGPSYLDMIKQIIVGRPEDARSGVSRQTLKKEIPLKFPKTKSVSDGVFVSHVNKAIAKGVETGTLTQAKNNGKVKLAAKAKKAAAPKKAPTTAAKKPAAKKAPSTAAKKPAAKKATTPKTKSSTATKAKKPAAKKTAAAAKPKAKRAPLAPTQAAAPKTKKAVSKK